MKKTRMVTAALEAFLVQRMRAYDPKIRDVIIRMEDPPKNGGNWDVVQISGNVSPSMLEKLERKVIHPLQAEIDLVDAGEGASLRKLQKYPAVREKRKTLTLTSGGGDMTGSA